MSTMIQFSLTKEREVQWSAFMALRPDLLKLGTTDAVKKILFDILDREVPVVEESKG